MRVKIIKPHKKYAVGQTLHVSTNEGFGLIDSGFAIQTKDVTSSEWQTNKEVNNGNTGRLRPNKRTRR